MSAPPPGYNPSESLLQGGNASIHGVMGGGGMGGGGTNDPNESLLSGGDSANITPLQGGSMRTYPAVATVVTHMSPELAKALVSYGEGQKKKIRRKRVNHS
jgi:hypothetical protein